MRSKWTRPTQRGTLYSTEVWEGDRRRTSVQLGRPGEQVITPDLILWGDSDHRLLIGQQVVMPDAPAQAVADSLRTVLANPAPGSGPPRRPRRIRVRRPDLADALRPVTDSLGIGLEVTDSLPFVDDLYRTFEARWGTPANQGYLDATELTEPAVAELFAAAASYYKARPWKTLVEGEPVLLECAAWTPSYRYVMALGAEGGIKGIALYESLKDIERLTRLSPDDPRAEAEIASIVTVALMFTRLSDLGPHRVEEAKAHGWMLASRNAYPLAVGTGNARESQWPTPAEARVLTAALRALPPFARSLVRPRLLPEDLLFFTETHRVEVAGEPMEVDATYPAPVRTGR